LVHEYAERTNVKKGIAYHIEVKYTGENFKIENYNVTIELLSGAIFKNV